jgi:hypothetical protein
MRNLAWVFIVILLSACGKNTVDLVSPPSQSSLLFPSQNSICITGINIQDNMSTVDFTWKASTNTDSYQINIKNLLNNTIITKNVNTNKVSLALLRGIPYSWFVTSISSKTTVSANSDVWRFYNATDGVVYYAPFPAELVSPGFNEILIPSSGKIKLNWIGSATDNNITGYDIYLGTNSSSLSVLKTNVTDMFLTDVSVTSATTYYWKIVTRDANGNTSESNIFSFMIK